MDHSYTSGYSIKKVGQATERNPTDWEGEGGGLRFYSNYVFKIT